MKKGMQGITLVTILIIFLVTIGGYFLINRAYSNILESGSNEAAINLWVKNRVASFGTDKIAEDYPPVRELNDPLKIRSREDLLWKGGKPPKAYEDIAN